MTSFLDLLPTLAMVFLCFLSFSPPLVTGQVTIDPTVRPVTSLDSGLDTKTRTQLVALHNVYRRDEKLATNMNKLEWSDYLEQEAAKWVTGCEFKHQVDPPWGENMYRSTYETIVSKTIGFGLLAWHLEVYNIMSGQNNVDCCSEKKKTCCHFTQMVWASSEYIGCAITRYDVLKGETPNYDYKNGWYLVCYYYPRGNVLAQQPYLRGEMQCSNCSRTNPDWRAYVTLIQADVSSQSNRNYSKNSFQTLNVRFQLLTWYNATASPRQSYPHRRNNTEFSIFPWNLHIYYDLVDLSKCDNFIITDAPDKLKNIFS